MENFDPLQAIVHCFQVCFMILEPKLLFVLDDGFAIFLRFPGWCSGIDSQDNRSNMQDPARKK